MAFLFGGARKANSEPIKDYQRELRKAIRTMDREDMKGALEEKTLINIITKQAREQKYDICKTKAKELIRLRAHRARLATMKGHMSTLSHQLSTVQSAKVMQETLTKTTHLLKGLNNRLDAKAIFKMLTEFERQSHQFSDTQGVLEETLDSIFETDNEQAMTEDAVSGIFEELKLNIELDLSRAKADHSLHPLYSDTDLASKLQNLKTN